MISLIRPSAPLAIILAWAFLAMLPAAAIAQTLRAGDVLNLTITGLPGASSTARISPDGKAHLAIVGNLAAAGKSIEALREEVDYILVDETATIIDVNGVPQRVPLGGIDFSLIVQRFAPVIVGGTVKIPGEVVFRPGMTALEAVALAGGVERTIGEQGSTVVVVAQLNSRISELSNARAGIAAELWRVDTFLAGPDDEIPPPLPDGIDPAKFDRLIAQQRNELHALQSDIEARARILRSQADVLGVRIALLEERNVLINEEIAILTAEVARFQGLRQRALINADRLARGERQLRQAKADGLEAEQELQQARLRLIEVQEGANTLKREARFKAVQERSNLVRSELENESALQSVLGVAASYGIVFSDASAPITTLVTVRRDGEVVAVGDDKMTFPLRSGDLVFVEIASVPKT